MTKLASIIIRTKNEERWINLCLDAVFNQKGVAYEVILVDNNSDDDTLARVKDYPIEIVSISDFIPGRALNEGIRHSKGDVVVCLSGHCIPKDDNWLLSLVEELRNPVVAGVYGRQLPLSFSSPLDKRDLLTMFGNERRVQKKDIFFHNANSAIRRDVWDLYPFCEEATNIEDRIWAKEVLAEGYSIVYSPTACVYHWHGVNHAMDERRAQRIVSILEGIIDEPPKLLSDYDSHKVFGIFCISKSGFSGIGEGELEATFQEVLSSAYVSKLVLTTDDSNLLTRFESSPNIITLRRPPHLSGDLTDYLEIGSAALNSIREYGHYPDVLVFFNEKYMDRKGVVIDSAVRSLLDTDRDVVIPVISEQRTVFIEDDAKEVTVANDGLRPARFKSKNAYVAQFGYGTAVRATYLNSDGFSEGKYGIIKISEDEDVI
jgi:glycosyltransferase involved in cell wall biosynthesis